MVQQHIDDDTLATFVKTATAASADTGNIDGVFHDEILDHLASCEECRAQAAIISTLQNDWQQLHHRSSLTEQQHQMICDYIDGQLSSEQAEKVKILIDEQPDAMKAALHYQSHITAMEAELSRKEKTEQVKHSTQQSQSTFVDGLLLYVSQFFSMRSPMVYTMAVTAALFMTVFILIQSPETGLKQTMIASYQDNSAIQFTAKNKLPGVGFFAQSGNTSKPFADILIELVSENTIKISWPEVDGAELYKMRIQVFNQGKKTVLKENATKTNHTTFLLETELQAPNVNKRYEWVLYGNTTDDRMFYASGGFVISQAGTELADNVNGTDEDSW